MTEVPIDGPEQKSSDPGPRPKGASRVAVEQEITKRHLIEAVTSVLLVVLYMAFTLIREREPGVVALDPDDDASNDWAD